MRAILPRSLTWVLLALLLASPSSADPVQLEYRPAEGAGPRYAVTASALLDYPLGRNVPVAADVLLGCSPGPLTPDGTYACFLFIQEGSFRILGESWDFSDQDMSWEWELTPQREIVASSSEATGLLTLVELFFRFVYVVQLPPHTVDVGDTWATQVVREADGSSLSLSATHRLAAVEQSDGGPMVAVIESSVEMPVDVSFVGSRFAGPFEGEATTWVDMATGEIEAVEVRGAATLANPGGSLDLSLREVSITMARSGEVTPVDAAAWQEQAEQRRGLAGNSFVDAILNANVGKYLEDNWRVFFPRFGNNAVDGTMLGAGVVGRLDRNYLYQLDGMYGTGARRGLAAFSLTRGYPIQPKDQQFLSYSNLDGGERLELGVTRYSGRQLGSTGIGRLRWGLSGTFSELVRMPPHITTCGRAAYVTASLTRFRTGESAVGYRSLDWEGVFAATFGGKRLGGRYDFSRLHGTLYGFYHTDADHTWAARLRATASFGEVPEQYRTALVSRGILRGFALGDAPLVRHSVAGSLEYRFRIDTPPWFDELGLQDWWGAVFVDAGVGANSYEGLLRSSIYADVGVTGRARVKYLGIPIYVWGSVAWPVSGRSGSPRVTLGLDWAF